jgi:hypothetical protein
MSHTRVFGRDSISQETATRYRASNRVKGLIHTIHAFCSRNLTQAGTRFKSRERSHSCKFTRFAAAISRKQAHASNRVKGLIPANSRVLQPRFHASRHRASNRAQGLIPANPRVLQPRSHASRNRASNRAQGLIPANSRVLQPRSHVSRNHA